MSDIKLYVFAAVLLLFVCSSMEQAWSSPLRTEPSPAPIRLKTATFTPNEDVQPSTLPAPAVGQPDDSPKGCYIVQFRGPVKRVWKDQVLATGAKLLDYIPEFAFKARMSPAQALRVQQIESVSWVGHFDPAYKLSHSLKRSGLHPYAVEVERGADIGLVKDALENIGVRVLTHEGNRLIVSAESSQLDAIAALEDVGWVHNLVLPRKHNEYAGAIMGAGEARVNGYDGSNQTIAIGDTGLGSGSPATAHPSIPSERIISISNWSGISVPGYLEVIDDGPQDVDSGHGTHVAVSTLGAEGPEGEGNGMAPGASLIFQALENYVQWDHNAPALENLIDGYYLIGLPSDIRSLFQQAYDEGARVHSDSWGWNLSGAYSKDSANVDDFVWSHPDMTIIFSAGNSGLDADGDGTVDAGSIESPASAKNVISVGASENDRSDGKSQHYECDGALGYVDCSGENRILTWEEGWGFTAEPLRSDPSGGNAEQMAAISSRGPAGDGRIKPDVVAPGTWILSGYSNMYQEGYGSEPNSRNGAYQNDGWGYPYNRYFKYLGGTSMSAPLVAGGAAIVREWHQQRGHNASAALVKATLINSAVDLLDENNDGVDDNAHPIPNNHEGWGRVDLTKATGESHSFIDETSGLTTGEAASYRFDFSGISGSPLKITLVWSDFPSSESAGLNLVNDLDLTVTSPSGTGYRGNVFNDGWTVVGGSADRVNNVENVYIEAAEAGSWTVKVGGYNVPNGPQPFALVVDNAVRVN